MRWPIGLLLLSAACRHGTPGPDGDVWTPPRSFQGRQEGRVQQISPGGGTHATEEAVSEALLWLARHQEHDGHWNVKGFISRCNDTPCSGTGTGNCDVGVTSLALLAFLGAGHTSRSEDRFGVVVQNALAWILLNQDREGAIGDRSPKHLYNHAIGTQALCEAYGMTGDAELRLAAQKATDFLVAAQNPGKGWRYSPRCGDNDSSVTGWAVMALKAAEWSGLKVPKAAFDGALAWMNEVTDRGNFFRTGYTRKNDGKVFCPGKNEAFENHPTPAAISVASRLLIQEQLKDPALMAVRLLLRDLPEWKKNKIDYYYWHWGSLALFQFDIPQGPAWHSWNESLQSVLVQNQKGTEAGCLKGSWDVDCDRWGFEGGRVYTTAINALTLETYYRYPRMVK